MEKVPATAATLPPEFRPGVRQYDLVFITINGLFFVCYLLFGALLYAFLEGPMVVLITAILNLVIAWLQISVLLVYETNRLSLLRLLLGPLYMLSMAKPAIIVVVSNVVIFIVFQAAAVLQPTTTNVWFMCQMVAAYSLMIVVDCMYHLSTQSELIITAEGASGALDSVIALLYPAKTLIRATIYIQGRAHEFIGILVAHQGTTKRGLPGVTIDGLGKSSSPAGVLVGSFPR